MVEVSSAEGIVHVWDLPRDSVCLRLPKETQNSMIDTALDIVSSPKRLSRILNVNRTTFYDFKKARFNSVSLSFVQKLSSFLEKYSFTEFSLKNLERKIELIKTKWIGKAILSPKFPMNFNNKEGAKVVSAFLFDGGIVHDLRPFYTNNDELLVDRVIENVKVVVGEIEFNKRSDGENVRVEFPKILGQILVDGLGMVPGPKIIKNPPIPAFILHSKPSVRRAFLQQAFDDEGLCIQEKVDVLLNSLSIIQKLSHR